MISNQQYHAMLARIEKLEAELAELKAKRGPGRPPKSEQAEAH